MNKIPTYEDVCDELAKTFGDFYTTTWKVYLKENYSDNSNRLCYIDAGLFSDYLIKHIRTNETQYFQVFFDKIEQFFQIDNPELYEFLTIGVLEGIQNSTSHTEFDYQTVYSKWLRPKTLDAWNKLIDFWGG
ncbi:hypothetical protein KBD33_05135 [Candidatus Gracilibacteria bacterium]|nr:hypothetical protein [Candidatus Gracilibacteria bacterium]